VAPVIASLRPHTSVPIAVGFGVRTAADVRAVHAAGADAAIVGSSFVAALETAPDPVAAARSFVAALG
jgi:tryptophan synthase alpha chain